MTETPDWTRNDDPFNDVLMEYQVRNIERYIRGDSVLDVGCNDGTLIRTLCPATAVGIDPNENAIKEARKHPMPFTVFIHGNIETLTSAPQFDTITLINVLEHVDGPVGVLSKVRELLSNDGVAIIHVPNANGLNRRLGVKMGMLDYSYQLKDADIRVGHKWFFDTASLREVSEEAGLYVSHAGSIMIKPFSNAQMQKIVDEWENPKEILDGLCKLAEDMPELGSPLWVVLEKCVRGTVASESRQVSLRP